MVLESGKITLKKILKFQLFARLDRIVRIIPNRKHSNLLAVFEGFFCSTFCFSLMPKMIRGSAPWARPAERLRSGERTGPWPAAPAAQAGHVPDTCADRTVGCGRQHCPPQQDTETSFARLSATFHFWTKAVT